MSYLVAFNDHDYLSVTGDDALKRRLVTSYNARPGDFGPEHGSLSHSADGAFLFGFASDWSRIEENIVGYE